MYTSDELTRTSGAIQAAISGIKQERLESQREDSQVMQEVDFLRGENERLEESVAEIRAMMDYEDQGWKAIFGAANGDKEEGLSLEEVKMISKKARVKVAGASLEKQASDLHGGYVFGQGLEIPGTEREATAENGKKKGRTKGEVRFFEDPINQENLFSDGAHKELQRARFTDGNVIVMCDETTKQVRRIPITEITGYITNPVRVFSDLDVDERLNVRIDDKLQRLASGREFGQEDTVQDLMGYLVLKRVREAQRN